MSPRAAWRLESLGFSRVYDYVGGKQNWLASGLPTEGGAASDSRAGHVARSDVPTCRLDESLDDVARRLRGTEWNACIVVNEQRVVLGVLRRDDLAGESPRRVEQAMRPGPSTFRPHVGIVEMARYLVEHDMESAPITTGDGELVGVLRRDDAVRAAEEAHDRIHEHDHG